MSFILTSIIQKKVPFWNKKVFTESDLFDLCKIHKARHYEDSEMKGKGEYTIHRGVSFVIINKNLGKIEKLWVGLHELGHHLLHYPVPHRFSKGTKRKLDREANIFASVALIPTYLVESKTLGDIVEEYGYPNDLILVRKEIYEENRI